jgi:hypothetical protein
VFDVTIAETTLQNKIGRNVIIHPSALINTAYPNIPSGTRTSAHLQKKISGDERITGTSKMWNQETKDTQLPPTSGCTPVFPPLLIPEIEIGQTRMRGSNVIEADLPGDTTADHREGETAGHLGDAIVGPPDATNGQTKPRTRRKSSKGESLSLRSS